MHDHLRRLTPLRFVAAILVVLYHRGETVPPFDLPWIHAVIAQSNVAVSFFFCLSGFIMATVYRDGVDARAYWIARFARIYPVYALALAACLVTGPDITAGQYGLDSVLLQAWVPGWAMTVNPPGWSLSVEVLFYALFPVLTRGLTARTLNRAILVVATNRPWARPRHHPRSRCCQTA